MASRTVTAFVDLLRPYNATIALISLSTGFFYPSLHKNWGDYFQAIILLFLLHSLATIHNDLNDYAIDVINDKKKPLTSHTLSKKDALILLRILFIILVIIGSMHIGPHVLFIVLFLIGSYWYNKQLSYLPILSIVAIAVLYTFLPILYGFTLNIPYTTVPYPFPLLLIGFTCVRFGISILKDFKDAKGDKQYHKKTFFLTFGFAPTIRVSKFFTGFGYLLIFFDLIFLLHGNIWLCIPIVLAIHAFVPRLFFQSSRDLSQANTIFHLIAFRENRFESSIIVWLIFFK